MLNSLRFEPSPDGPGIRACAVLPPRQDTARFAQGEAVSHRRFVRTMPRTKDFVSKLILGAAVIFS